MSDLKTKNTMDEIMRIVNMKLQIFRKKGGVDPYVLIRVYERRKEYSNPQTEVYESSKATIDDINRSIKDDKKALIQKCNDIQNDLNTNNNGKSVSRSQNKIDHVIKEKERLIDITEKIKDVCDKKSNIILDNSNSIDPSILTKQIEIIQFEDNIDIVDYEDLQDKIQKLQFALDRFKTTIHKQFDELNELRNKVKMLEKNNQDLKSMISNDCSSNFKDNNKVELKVVKGGTFVDMVLTYEKKYDSIEPNCYGHIIDINDASKNVKEDQLHWEQRHNMWMRIPAKKRRFKHNDKEKNDSKGDDSDSSSESSDEDFRSDEEEDIDFEYYY